MRHLLSSALLLVGCSTTGNVLTTDGGALDAASVDGGPVDAGPVDGGPIDAGAPPDAARGCAVDAGPRVGCPCVDDDGCPSEEPFCNDEGGGVCGECRVDDDCGAGAPYCLQDEVGIRRCVAATAGCRTEAWDGDTLVLTQDDIETVDGRWLRRERVDVAAELPLGSVEVSSWDVQGRATELAYYDRRFAVPIVWRREVRRYRDDGRPLAQTIWEDLGVGDPTTRTVEWTYDDEGVLVSGGLFAVEVEVDRSARVASVSYSGFVETLEWNEDGTVARTTRETTSGCRQSVAGYAGGLLAVERVGPCHLEGDALDVAFEHGWEDTPEGVSHTSLPGPELAGGRAVWEEWDATAGTLQRWEALRPSREVQAERGDGFFLFTRCEPFEPSRVAPSASELSERLLQYAVPELTNAFVGDALPVVSPTRP